MKPILELVPNSAQQSLFFNHYEQKRFDFPLHYHPQWELIYLVEGTGTAYTGNAVRHFVANELALIAPNTPHCWKSDELANNSVKSVFVQWDNQFLGEDWLNKPEFSTVKKMFESCKTGLSFPQCQKLGERLVNMQHKSPFQRMISFIDLLHELSLHDQVEPLGQQSALLPSTTSDRRIESILNYIDKFYSRKIMADEMATLVNMTPVSFSKYFKRTFHKTFTQFLNEFRVSQSCGLLISTELAVEEVAYQCGYQNMSFFHRQFKIITQKTPNNFRVDYHR